MAASGGDCRRPAPPRVLPNKLNITIRPDSHWGRRHPHLLARITWPGLPAPAMCTSPSPARPACPPPARSASPSPTRPVSQSEKVCLPPKSPLFHPSPFSTALFAGAKSQLQSYRYIHSSATVPHRTGEIPSIPFRREILLRVALSIVN